MLPLSLAALLAACSGTPKVVLPAQSGSTSAPVENTETQDSANTSQNAGPSPAQWVQADWRELPGFDQDAISEAWKAWVASCQRPKAVWQNLCKDVLQRSDQSETDKRLWILQNLQVYRLQDQQGKQIGKLTSYYEPVFNASRLRAGPYYVPLYAPPQNLRSPWFSREEIDSKAAAQDALRGKDWVYLASPVEMLNLHIQGSGKLLLRETNGATKMVRAAFAGTNGLTFQSPMRWLLQTGKIRSANWPAVQRWADENPGQVKEMLWKNPRYVFFKEEALPAGSDALGPKGAEGVALTAGRSIAVDPRSIPYGTPVWLSSNSESNKLNRLVMAQDTGNAITGAVRADYFAGSGKEAGEFAERINQNLRLWALWPKGATPPNY